MAGKGYRPTEALRAGWLDGADSDRSTGRYPLADAKGKRLVLSEPEDF